jgi:hypothetical protein
MSQTRKNGRPPKASPDQFGTLDDWPGDEVALLGEPGDASYKWHVPRAEILDGIKTIGGIARLACVDRRTVRRWGVTPYSREALRIVIERRREMGRPLFERAGEAVMPERLRAIVKFCEDYKLKLLQGQQSSKTVVWADAPVRRWNRKGSAQQFSPGWRLITEEEKTRVSKWGFYYKPASGRVTVKMLCSAMFYPYKALCGWHNNGGRITRQAFYKWRAGLTRGQRSLLDLAMAGDSRTAPPTDTRQVPIKEGQFRAGDEGVDHACDEGIDFDDMDARNGWVE